MHHTCGQKMGWLLALLVLSLGSVRAQLIWPGDVNNNGVVSAVDLLYLGVAFGETGPQRPGATTDFAGQPAGLPWAQNFPNGVNYAYADADGNGIVDANDLDDGIEDNFGLEHGVVTGDGYANAAPGTGPALRLVPEAGVVQTASVINIDLILGDASAPVEDFYGVAFALSYQTAQGSDAGELEFETADAPWYDPTENNSLDFYAEDDNIGTAALAMTRTDQLTVSGGGELGRFSVVIEDIIANETVDTLILSIDSILLIGADLTPQEVAPFTTRVIVADDPNSVTAIRTPQRSTPAWRVFPNPVRTTCQVRGPDDILGWRLVDPRGGIHSLTPERVGPGHFIVYPPPGLPPGLYVLQAVTPGEILQEKIFFDTPF